MENGNIIAYLQMIVEAYRLFAEEKKIYLNFYAEKLSLEIDFVPHYIEEIARNLLSNAIKFTSPGGTITLSVLTHKNSEVTIKVRDNGKGISPEELKLIFEPFYQSSDVDIKTGSGIGLHYTKQLTEAMSGKISAESKLGEGSVFSVTLPVNNPGIPFLSLKMDEMLKAPSFTRNEKQEHKARQKKTGTMRMVK